MLGTLKVNHYICAMVKKKTKKAYPSYEVNPSIVIMNGVSEGEDKHNRNVKSKQQKEEERREKEAKDMLVTDPHTGEQKTGVFIESAKAEEAMPTEPFVYDSLPYSKWFDDLDLSKLTMSAICVLQYIKERLKPKQDVVEIYSKECMEQFGWGSKSNFYKAIANLLENEVLFVKAGVESRYFLNVNKIHNGDRTFHFRKMRSAVKKDKNYKRLIAETKAKYLGPKNKETNG